MLIVNNDIHNYLMARYEEVDTDHHLQEIGNYEERYFTGVNIRTGNRYSIQILVSEEKIEMRIGKMEKHMFHNTYDKRRKVNY